MGKKKSFPFIGFIILKGLYSLFSAVERFPYLRDMLNHFGLKDFSFKDLPN